MQRFESNYYRIESEMMDDWGELGEKAKETEEAKHGTERDT